MIEGWPMPKARIGGRRAAGINYVKIRIRPAAILTFPAATTRMFYCFLQLFFKRFLGWAIEQARQPRIGWFSRR
jgi:hypothetical protein